MITVNDTILALSCTGETRELYSIPTHPRRFRVPLIAMTPPGKHAGNGAMSSALPPVKEACPHGLAVTTSMLTQPALGDRLVIALLKDVRHRARCSFHPAGQLGADPSMSAIMYCGDRLPVVPPPSA